MTVKNFVWDFDGMLFDTYPHTVAAFCECCRRFGIPAEKGEVYALMKVTIRHALRHYGFDEAMTAAFYEIENDLSFPPRGVPYPHVPAVLREIAAAGGKNYLYTHRDAVALQYLELYGLKNLFSGFITAEDGYPLKPAPDALSALTARCGMLKEETLMLGDRDIDIGAGVNAGVRTLLYDDEGRYPLPLGEDVKCTDGESLMRAVREMLGTDE